MEYCSHPVRVVAILYKKRRGNWLVRNNMEVGEMDDPFFRSDTKS